MKSGSRTEVILSPLIPVSSVGSRLKLLGAVGLVRMIVKVAEPLPGLVPLLLLATASTVNVPDLVCRIRERQSERATDESLVVITCGLKEVPSA